MSRTGTTPKLVEDMMNTPTATRLAAGDVSGRRAPVVSRPGRVLLLALLGILLFWPALTGAAESPRVRHPNLLVNQQEIDQIKAKIREHPWAAELLADLRGQVDAKTAGRTPRETAIVYVLTGDASYGEKARRAILQTVRREIPRYANLDLHADPDFGSWGTWAPLAWAYDLTYDLFTDEERREVETLLRTAARTIIDGLKIYRTTPNLVFEKHWKVGIIGYCLGDEELIEWAMNDRSVGERHGGFYPVLDSIIKDGHFWNEAPIYALVYDLHGMLALAEAARHYDGTDLYNYVSPQSGASIRSVLDGYLRMAFPLENTGVRGGSLRLGSFGDGSTGFLPSGSVFDTFLINPVDFPAESARKTMNAELEIAWTRYRDPGYAWLLSLNPRRDADMRSAGKGDRPAWAEAALTHGEPLPHRPTPPEAPSGLYPTQGFAMLRADQSPRYWTSGALAVMARTGASIGHGHADYFSIILHGKGRLLYPDLNVIQYEPTWLNWTREGIAHNTLLIDQRSPQPGESATRHDFNADVNFLAVAGSAFESSRQVRALLLTGEYLADVFRAEDVENRPRTFDWILHGLGRLCPGNPAAYEPSDALVPHYWWIENQRSRTTGDAWQADWVQKSGGMIPGVQEFAPEWFQRAVGVRMTMLGVAGTEVFCGDGPLTDGPPYHRIDGQPEGACPLVVARRKAPSATFAAVHEPYETRSAGLDVRRLEETDRALGLAVRGAAFSDRVLIAFDESPHTLGSAAGESFTFRNYGYLRVAGDKILLRGEVTAFRLQASAAAGATLLVQGRQQPLGRDGEFWVFGAPASPGSVAGESISPIEQQAALHWHFRPEEVRLSAGSQREVALELRAAGKGEAGGQLRLSAPPGIRVEPDSISVDSLRDGQEQTVRLRVSAARDATSALYAIRVEPLGETPAARGELPVSVGVVITEDHRVPMLAQYVIRAPGYAMKVDQLSGTAPYLLDADGHRRHGTVYKPGLCDGLGAFQSEGDWVVRYHQPCQFIWRLEDNTLLVGTHHRFRLHYTFHEERIVLELVSHATQPKPDSDRCTLWLGRFDALGSAVHNAPPRSQRNEPPQVDWIFFPHPVYRQGVLLQLPEKTTYDVSRQTMPSVPVRPGQQVVLRFATREELPGLVGSEATPAAK